MKFGRQKEWLTMADNNIFVAIVGKMLPQFIIFFVMMSLYLIYIWLSRLPPLCRLCQDFRIGFPHGIGITRTGTYRLWFDTIITYVDEYV